MQNIFTKLDKKILIILIVVSAVILVAGYFVYKYSREVEKIVQNNEDEAIIETQGEQATTPETILPGLGQEQPSVNLGNPQIEIQPQPGLTVCVDQCGDGICQPAGTICDNDLNCICAETKADCPGDCK